MVELTEKEKQYIYDNQDLILSENFEDFFGNYKNNWGLIKYFIEDIGINIFEYMTSIPDYVFKDTYITNIISNTILSIGEEAFSFCESLETINLPNCEKISHNAFEECTSLETINIPNCAIIGCSAFSGCKSLETINLPNCEIIDGGAFENCNSLKTINLPNCEEIGDKAFWGCEALRKITLPQKFKNDLERIGIKTTLTEVVFI